MIDTLERSLVGSLILEPELIPEVRSVLNPRDFADDSAREIFETLLRLYENGTPIDLLTVCHSCRVKASIITGLTDGSNVDHDGYSRIIKEESVRRRAQEMDPTQDLSEAKVGEVGITLEKMSGKFLQMADSVVDAPEKTLGELAEEITLNVKTSLESGSSAGGLVGISTGFPRLNRVTAGFEPGELVIVAARTSIGKTSLALNFATNMSLYGGHSVAFYSIEMTARALAMRIQSSLADVDSAAIAQGRASVYELRRLEEAQVAMAGMPLHVAVPLRGRGWTLERLEGHARRVAGLKAIFVDYIQIMDSGLRGENRVQEVSTITRGLKGIATRMGVPVIAMSQLRRTQDPDAEPTLSDLRESGSIEQDADMVIFLHRPYTTDRDRAGDTDLIVAKNRRGRLAKMTMRFNFSTTTFTDRIAAVPEPS